MGRLPTDSDLIDAVSEICAKENIELGRFEAIGAVRKARIGYYDQHQQKYFFHEMDRPLEITKLTGNVSMRDGAPTLHAHITLADSDGRAFGGHVAQGTIIYACEFILEVYEGPAFLRSQDETTGLPLWEI